jgi:protoporphyrinogen/coproporphyrinogen III oxidase
MAEATGAPRVVVVGAGITGLAAARILDREGGAEVVVLEASRRAGGKIRTLDIDGAPVEAGPDWFLTTNPAALDLCRELGLTDDLVRPVTAGAHIWQGGRLVPFPTGFVRGVPASPRALLRCRSLTPAARLRGLADLVLPGPLSGPDVSVQDFVRRRFGSQVLERVADPMLAASRSGRTGQLGLAAAAPEIDAAARSSRSVMRGLAGMQGPAGTYPFVGLAGGMERLVDRLRASLKRTDLRCGRPVRAIRAVNGRYEVVTDGDAIAAEAVVVALPAHAAHGVLRPLDEALADDLGRITYSSTAVVSFLYPAGSVPAPPGASGWLVPSSEHGLLIACAWYSRKWAHARPHGGGAVMRCFAGRSDNDPALSLSDTELCARLAAEIATVTRAKKDPLDTHVTRWDDALPLYSVGHLELIKEIEGATARHPGLELAGAGYRGSGLPDCITQGEAAARRVLADIRQGASG